MHITQMNWILSAQISFASYDYLLVGVYACVF